MSDLTQRIAKSPSLDLQIRSGLIEEFFDVPNMTLLRWEENNILSSNKISVGRRTIRQYDPKNIYTILEQRKLLKKPPEPFIYAVWNNKGGVGKSTLTFELSLMMTLLMGLKVLVIDTDSQADTTHLFNADDLTIPVDQEYKPRPSLYDIFEHLTDPDHHNEASLDEIFNRTVLNVIPGLDLIPADERLSEMDYDLFTLDKILYDEKGTDITRLGLLNHFVKHISKRYDVVLVDSAPNIAILNLNVLFATNRLLIPTELEPKCIHSIQRVSNRLTDFQRLHSNFKFDRIIIVPNKMNQSVIAATALVRLKDLVKSNISRTFLSQTVTLDKAIQHHHPIFCYQDNSVKWFDKIPTVAKRLTNQFWDLCHDMLDLEAPAPLFKPRNGEDEGIA